MRPRRGRWVHRHPRPRAGATYNRVTIVAIRGATMPSLADGFDRLVTTTSFTPPLAPHP